MSDKPSGPGDPGTVLPVAFGLKVPPGEDRERLVCERCGFVNYINPRIVVGSVVTLGERFVLCRRAIEPRRGYWTLPAGFLESHETTREGAAREAREEANAEIEIGALLAVYEITRITQVQIFYRARLLSEIAPGTESLEVALVTWADIPWRDLAFPSVVWALHHHDRVQGKDGFAPFANPPAGEFAFPFAP